MSEALDRLKEIGIQKIYEDTHIPVEHVQALLYESFEGMNRIQFLGFVSILEREYSEDFTTLRSKGIEYFDEKKESLPESITDDTIFKVPNKKSRSWLYTLFAVALFIFALLYTTKSQKKEEEVVVVENPIVEEAKRKILADINSSEFDRNKSSLLLEKEIQKDINKSADFNQSMTLDENKTEVQKAVPQSFKIIAKTKVWLGYIDVVTNKKYQKTFQGEFDLDPLKEWLLYFGHGYVEIAVDDNKTVFNDKNTLRIHYKDGRIEKISVEEFKKLNRGNKW